MRYDVVPIKEPVEGFLSALKPLFNGHNRDVTEENIQSRTRGVILMAISNKFGSMVLTTGNKSEMSVGYATLYGDMNGGYNPIKDVYKTRSLPARRMAQHSQGPSVIPERIITKAPTAELRENQTDQDTLPPYDVLDDILSLPRRGGNAGRRDRQARPSGSAGQARPAHALCRRIQAAAGGARRQDHAAQFRPRPALSDHQRLSGYDWHDRSSASRPRPPGRIHIGNARTAILNWLFARKNAGGSSCCAIDDTDVERSKPEFADGIADDLDWLGIMPDQVEHQSKRSDAL